LRYSTRKALHGDTALRPAVPSGRLQRISQYRDACAADVSIAHGRPRIHRVSAAVHCGLAVNPLSIESQIEGGLIFGITQLVPKARSR